MISNSIVGSRHFLVEAQVSASNGGNFVRLRLLDLDGFRPNAFSPHESRYGTSAFQKQRMRNDTLVFSSSDSLEVVTLELAKEGFELALTKVFLQNMDQLWRFVNLEAITSDAPRNNVCVSRSFGIVQHIVQPERELGRTEVVGLRNTLLLERQFQGRGFFSFVDDGGVRVFWCRW